MKRVLFLSTRNAARSLMAEAWLNRLGAGEYTAESAGTQPADAVHPLAVEVMQEANVDLSTARPRSSEGLRGDAYDLVVVLAPREGEESPQLPGAREVVTWSFDDPRAAEDLSEDEQRRRFRHLRDELHTRITLFVNATTDLSPPPTRPESE
jgi:protein-tyrosine-phosphatase